jgi:hypothetical protein
MYRGNQTKAPPVKQEPEPLKAQLLVIHFLVIVLLLLYSQKRAGTEATAPCLIE